MLVQREREAIILKTAPRTQQVTEGRRLGCGKTFAAWDDVKANAFFANTDWEALAQKKTTPPVLPSDPGKDMVNNFDDDFTK